MVKQIQKNNPIKSNYYTLIIASFALTLSIVAICAVWTLDQNTRLWSDSNLKNDVESSTRYGKLEFCYNNSIHPCDDISLKEFNERPENKATKNIFPL